MTLTEIASVLGGVGAGGVLTKMAGSLLGRRRERADVLDQLEQISARLVARAEKRMSEAERRMTTAETRVRELDRKLTEITERDQRRQIAAAKHAAWDTQVAASLHELGVVVAPPPPLEDIE